jgi:L-ascorbate metabolism protein UlaG (beta-lactamase superfamily)
MAVRPISISLETGGVSSLWRASDLRGLGLAWLGQAGFAFRYGDLRAFLDPYLSDFLEKKYRGTPTSHERLMPAPILAQEIEELDFVICSHHHSDHMDPESLPILASRCPSCRFIVPKASRSHALKMGVPERQIVGIDAGEKISLAQDCVLEATPSAHELLERNDLGEYRFLGYIIQLGSRTLYHSGDSIPYASLSERVSTHRVDLALLPINGRGKGVPGNFTFAEAVQLCREAAIPYLIPHHFGMFAFNTVDQEMIKASAAKIALPVCLLPDTSTVWMIT